jgi:PAS domain S-box-containing protein
MSSHSVPTAGTTSGAGASGPRPPAPGRPPSPARGWRAVAATRSARYAVVLAVTGLAAGLKVAYPQYFGPLFILFYPAVMVGAVYGGLGAGLLATAASALATVAWVLPSELRGRPLGTTEAVSISVFCCMGVLVSLLSEGYRRARARVAREARRREVLEVEARAAVAQAEVAHRYDLLAARGRDIILFVRLEDGRILDANAAAAAAYRCTHEELLQLNVQDLRTPGERAATSGQMAAADAHGLRFETVHLRRDGSTFPVEVDSQGGALGGVRMLVSVIRDITDRRRAEALLAEVTAALRESEARYRATFEHAGVGVALVESGSGRFLQVNARFAALLGYRPGELVGRSWSDVTHPDDLPSNLAGLEVMVAARAPFASEKRYLRKDGTVVWASATVSPVEPASEPLRTQVAVFEDVSERRRAEAELREADQRKTAFLALLSHELRNPLAPIRNGVAILGRSEPGSEAARRAVDVLARQTDHLARLVDDLLDLTRVTHGKIELQTARLDARQAARQCCDDALAAYQAGGVGLDCAPGPEPAWVEADPARLAQLIGNLVANALKFTPPGGRVGVRVERHGEACRIAVKDSGVGIEPQDLARIFQPFVQVERSRLASRGGLGLGLALVKELARLHGGEAGVTSAGRGQGSEFVVTLPLAAPPPVAAEPPRRRPGRCLSILLVEDEADAGETLAELLGMAGHRVAVANTGRAGVAMAAGTRPDVIICDVGLPDMSGYQVVREIRALPAAGRLLAIALTGHALPADRLRALEAGFDAHLAKPLALEQLVELLDAAPRAVDPVP